MRALTLTQPWAGLVASGIKLVENRPRKMIKAEDFGKPFAIHASKTIDEATYFRIMEIAPEMRTESNLPDITANWYRLSRATSAVIAVATLADAMYIGGCNATTIYDAVARAGLDPDEQHRWTFGPTAYVLRDVHALARPVPCRGWQGFWTLPHDVEREVRVQLPCDAGGIHVIPGKDVQCSKCLAEVR